MNPSWEHNSELVSTNVSGKFFYWKLTIWTTILIIKVNNDMYCLQKWIEKVPAVKNVRCFSNYVILKQIKLP